MWIVLGVVFIFALFSLLFKVPYLPTRKKELEVALALAEISSKDTVVDLGAGDGRVLFAIAKQTGATVIGYEVNPILWLIANWRLRGLGKVYLADFWQADLAHATVIFTFLIPVLNKRLEEEVWPRLQPGTRLICNLFPLPQVAPTKVSGKVFLYVR